MHFNALRRTLASLCALQYMREYNAMDRVRECNAMHRIGVYLAMQYTGCEVTMQCTGWDNTRNQPPLANPPPLLLLRGQTWTTAVIQKILRNADLFRTHQYWHRNLLFLHHLDDAVGENCILQQGHLRMLRVAKCHGYGGYVPVEKLTKSRKWAILIQIKLTLVLFFVFFVCSILRF